MSLTYLHPNLIHHFSAGPGFIALQWEFGCLKERPGAAVDPVASSVVALGLRCARFVHQEFKSHSLYAFQLEAAYLTSFVSSDKTHVWTHTSYIFLRWPCVEKSVNKTVQFITVEGSPSRVKRLCQTKSYRVHMQRERERERERDRQGSEHINLID